MPDDDGDIPEPDKASGTCVMVVLGGIAVVVLFRTMQTVAVLLTWVAGAVALYRAAHKQPAMSDTSATPPPEEAPPSGDVYARETGEVKSVVQSPEGVTCTVHPVRVEVPDPRNGT
jgi:hypothetical protein